MFNRSFKVVENHRSGLIVTHILYGKKKDIEHDIELFKKNSSSFVMFGSKGMVVWE